MKIAFIIDPFKSLNIKKDSTLELIRAAQLRHHETVVIEQHQLYLLNNQVMAIAQEVFYNAQQGHYLGAQFKTPLNIFDGVFMRLDPPLDINYIVTTYLLEKAEKEGVLILNKPNSLRSFNEKLSTTLFPQFTPELIVTSLAEEIKNFVSEQREVILKPLDAMGGSGIFKINAQDPNLNVIIETLTQDATRSVMAQRFIPAIEAGDKRVLIINGEVAQHALARIPKQGETRGNLAAGGRGVAMPLTKKEQEIATTVAPFLQENGLFIVGLDIIGEYLTEINITSPTCMREIRDQTGEDIADKTIKALEKILNY
ncbi:MAG: glutathione synthase [Ferrovum sp. 37-45-19]|jgi:glutathione synthase|uniref:glutathione synthase n=1 Tax=Ferrovum sp. JA12 TaxID=1356299 RepID=UPI0007027849|nr:glutathione synthase [Ferrovum sp. JA12]OYV79545.1 MAG: glutathione synthase [Ferrovum sp. 21-44-67]OYV94661.1 MAG: glutathione synthase [Ferrovum sp. 37-45-19]OZB34518.1 MAG: glutathione synthase [Ferrovum sp. 34-44-207]HQT81464.1 glutathione synthase [Ferrovaceae bacterium]KRH79433.1 glutathione synthetase [Ferrovum sp. JA12]